MVVRRGFPPFLLAATILAAVFPGCWTSMTFDPDNLVFKEQVKAGDVIGTVVVDASVLEADTVVIGGDCLPCFDGTSAITERLADIKIKSPYSPVACKDKLSTDPSEDGALRLRFCRATFQLTSQGTNVGAPVAATIFFNQAPNLLPNAAQLALDVDENSDTELEIIVIRSDDPDVLSTEYLDRQLVLESCVSLSDPTACPFGLRGASCTTDGVRCNTRSDRPVPYTLYKRANHHLDYEAASVHYIKLTLTDAFSQDGRQRNKVEYEVRLGVNDLQDMPPIFMVAPSNIAIMEKSPEDTIVESVTAQDQDRVNPSVLTYTLCEIVGSACEEESARFYIPPLNGALRADVTVKTPFTIDDYPLGYTDVKITAIEVGQLDQTASHTIRITITDVNDKPAVFFRKEQNGVESEVTGITATIDENSPTGNRVDFHERAQIWVRDKDRDVNARFTLAIEETNSPFVVSPATGQGNTDIFIFVGENQILDAEEREHVVVTILSRNVENPRQVQRLEVTIRILDVNDVRPYLTIAPNSNDAPVCSDSNPLIKIIPENVFPASPDDPEPATILFKLIDHVHDKDREPANQVVQYSLTGFSSGLFKVSEVGVIEVDGELDYDFLLNHEHRGTITVRNQGANGVIVQPYECPLVIRLTNVNDELPRITEYREKVEILENSNAFTNGPVTVLAEDRDEDAVLTFRMNLVRAENIDGVKPPAAAFKLEDHIEILTEAPTASDPWVGRINVKQPFDWETTSTIFVEIIVTDNADRPEGSPQQVHAVTVEISVGDQQDMPPKFTEVSKDPEVMENDPVDTLVATLKAEDGDRGDPSPITYSLCQCLSTGCVLDSTEDCTPSSHFKLDIRTETVDGIAANVADIVVAELFSSDVYPNGYTQVQVKAEENGKSVTQLLRIVVEDRNDKAALFLKKVNGGEEPVEAITATIDENSPGGSRVDFHQRTQIVVRDTDRGVNAHFTLTIVETDSPFVISPTTGQGYTNIDILVGENQILNAEERVEYVVTILSRNSEGPPQDLEEQLVVTIQILDVNDVRPYITLTPNNDADDAPVCSDTTPLITRLIPENVFPASLADPARATILFKLREHVHDKDQDPANRQLQYSLTGLNSRLFSVSADGVIEVTGELDYDQLPNHEHTGIIVIQNQGAKGGTLELRCPIVIRLSGVNDETPQFKDADQVHEYVIQENVVPTEAIFTVRADDRDGDAASLVFRPVVIQATDSSGVVAKDFKLEDHIRITTLERPAGSIEWTARLEVNKAFDWEATETIRISVIAEDIQGLTKQNTSITVTIVVRDVNDNAPILTYNYAVVSGKNVTDKLPELLVEEFFMDFRVSDKDSGVTVFHPELDIPQPYGGHIRTEKPADEPGLIRLVVFQPFNYSEIQNLNFTLTVHDTYPIDPTGGRSSTVDIQLGITDRNNLHPVITFPEHYVENSTDSTVYNITEADSRQTGTFVPRPLIRVLAVDGDSELYQPFQYFMIYDENAAVLVDKVVIDKDTGDVSVVQPLDREALGMSQIFKLQLMVKDNARQSFDQRQSETITIAVRITDVNDNPPVFSSTNGFAVTLLEKDNIVDGNELPFRDIQATDADLPEGCGKIQYSILTEGVPLTMNPESGAVTLREKLTGTLKFEVQATDDTSEACRPGNTAKTEMTVSVMSQELLYEVIVDLEMDDDVKRNATLDNIENVLRSIGVEQGYDYVRYSIQTPATRATAAQVINFSYLHSLTKVSAPRENVTKWLYAKIGSLQDLGVTAIGTDQVVDRSTGGEPFDMNLIAVIILAILVLSLLITIAIFFAERRKLARKLRVYKASEAAAVDNKAPPAGQSTFSPYAAGGTQKQNPIHNLDNRLFLQLEGHTYTEDDLDEVTTTSDADSVGSRKNALENFFDIEAATAQANRQNMQAKLRESGF